MKPIQYIILLRAVNVSGKNILKMAELKTVLSKAGFENCQTYIQSGNILLESALSKNEIKVKIEHLILEHFNLSIESFVLTAKELTEAIKNNPFDKTTPGNKLFITFLSQIPLTENINLLRTIDLGKEEYHIHGDILYFYVPDGMSNSKLSNSFIENKLKLKSTGRNLNTIQKLIQLTQN